ncbi:GlxA family transcriptional regulator [Bradyrhizobium sp. SYSU BS000235]|uniref:GlxA family transcriptional regulator n=1 Tax=Bradyrhizobium sp. SYSU BS000235 TaxID=3411332 RepID=UPI003C70F86E
MRRIGYIAAPDFHFMSLAALSVFEIANRTAPQRTYDVRLLSEAGGLLTSSIGMSIHTHHFDETKFDTLIVGGGLGIVEATPALVAFVQSAQTQTRRMASACSGAFVLAEAGLLDHRRATTHWLHAHELKRRYPKVSVQEDRIFINDGPVWTSGGGSAGVDLALGMVEQDLGDDIALTVAKKLVLYHRRAGGQSQHSTLLDLSPKSDRIQSAIAYARRNLNKPLSIGELAAVANLSPRQFSRAFHAETGQSPAKAIEKMRVEAAKLMLEQGRHPIETIADETGFADRERMRRAFLRTFGQPPQAIRRNARSG